MRIIRIPCYLAQNFLLHVSIAVFSMIHKNIKYEKNIEIKTHIKIHLVVHTYMYMYEQDHIHVPIICRYVHNTVYCFKFLRAFHYSIYVCQFYEYN